ncbi:ATPase AAA [Aeromonas salmonicida subsp. salmonicida]|uniref:TniB n=2 Tax=Aeromonas salmonicida subsp. salmonicida TaxID=29491 RepID=A4SJU8_AERS4|nr:TniB family NTP-binding protein [Aeromonas salmonicida]ABO89170.1 TniB [Aeromonas salmonicida subsp. salmonicida A449]AYO62288.1 AAA family ATPase [Aeromonas salmonicida subsp. salmonicida 01-B526]EHI51648.1 TniB [Aeromonas salmonicida subsp. salmonicida 01-B526]EKP0254011.1 TniB family NTP-binding protein [Aeromonas salmonicida]EKP0266800.1 TniB family NTP-binding protein [Aeromonas salmonicida]
MTTYSHLNDSAIEALALSDRDRILKIRSERWIGYPKAKQILAKLEDLLIYPRTHRMPNLLIVGDTNNGKTMLVQRFKNLHPAIDNPSGEGIQAPVILVQAPPVPDEGRFYNAILELLFAPYRPSERVDKKQFQAIKLLRYVGLKVLIIDEIHHILAGNMNRQKAFLNVIKYLGNELQISIIGVGTKDAFRALQTDPQISNRFEPVTLPRWEMDHDFQRLLASFERMLPLKQISNLSQHDMASTLYAMSEGYIGELSRLLSEASVLAIHSGVETISAKILQKVDWTPPSKRKRQLEGVR